MPKSWDILPSSTPATRAATKTPPRKAIELTRRRAPALSPRSEQQQKPLRTVKAETHLVNTAPIRRSGAASSGRGVGSLRERRKTKRKRLFRFALIVLIIVCIGAIALVWQPFIRVQTVDVTGPHALELPAFVRTTLQGTRYGIFPKDSIFFVPTDQLRVAILTQFPDIEAVSLAPQGLTTLAVSGTGRATAFWWCGPQYVQEHTLCFEADTSGKIFNLVNASSTSASTTPFMVFAPYQGGLSDNSPLGGSIENSSKLPDMFRFVKTLKGLGAPVVSAHIRGDEADLYTGSGTRITYVLGREEAAVALAATALPTLDLQSNAFLYVDLRFTSKIYFKKRVNEVGPPAKVR